MKPRIRIAVPAAAMAFAIAGCVARPTWRGDEGTAYEILNQSTIALLRVGHDTAGGPFESAMRDACAVLVFAGATTGVPVSTGARGDGVLLARDPATRHWSGPAFYERRALGADGHEHVDGRGELITVGCDALHRLYAVPAGERVGARAGTDGSGAEAGPGMRAWTLATAHREEAPPRTLSIRPLPAIATAYYQAPAPLGAILVDRSVHNDASFEILAAIARLAP